jgi:hypothetical protein
MPTPITCPDLSQYQRLASGELQGAGRDVLLRHVGVTDPDGKVRLEGLPDLQPATTEGKGP